jgi:hypothetical protein
MVTVAVPFLSKAISACHEYLLKRLIHTEGGHVSGVTPAGRKTSNDAGSFVPGYPAALGKMSAEMVIWNAVGELW